MTTAPILPSRDFAATLAYYEALGFERLGGAYPEYLMISRGDWELHFFLYAALDPACNYHGAYRRGEDVDVLSAAWAAVETSRSGIPRMIPVEDKDWGMRELALVDPDGNLLRVGVAL